MASADLRSLLREVEFLEGVDEESLERIAGVSRLVDYARGALVFREGDPATHIYLVTQGNVSIEICAPGVGCRRILTVGPGDLLGWSPVLEESHLTATARALVPTRLIEINAGQILTLCEHNPRFGYELMRRAARALARRLSATRLQLLDVYGSQMPDAES